MDPKSRCKRQRMSYDINVNDSEGVGVETLSQIPKSPQINPEPTTSHCNRILQPLLVRTDRPVGNANVNGLEEPLLFPEVGLMYRL